MTVLAGLCAAGCGTKATVADFSGNRIEVRRVKLSPEKDEITVLQGNATRSIRVKDIDLLSIYPQVTRTHSGKLFYQAEVILQDGTKIGFSDPGIGKPADSYICIDGELQGEVEGGKYRISFDNIGEVEIRD